jgi:sec-independent protein translocase protein TatA
MFEGAFSPMHWLVVLVIALLIFGPRRLPEVGKGLGSAIRGFREGLRGGDASQGTPADTSAAEAAKPSLTDGPTPKG